MKNIFYLFFIYLITQKAFGQILYLKIHAKNKTEQSIIDSTRYISKHTSLKDLLTEIKKTSEALQHKGYLSLHQENLIKENDSSYTKTLDLGKKQKHLFIYIGRHKDKLETNTDTIKIKIEEIENKLSTFSRVLEKKGYALSQIKLEKLRNYKKELIADLEIKLDIQRKIDDIIITGYDKFPKNHLINLKRKFKKLDYTQNNLIKLQKVLNSYSFARQTKTPDILFTKDSTKIYTNLEKIKSNTFEGFIGFNNNNGKFNLNGHIDLKLTNLLNSGENLSVYWKNNGDQQTTFQAKVEFPHIFKSSFILNGELNLFKQDSLFQRSTSEIKLGYLIHYNARLFLGYQTTESSNLQDKDLQTLNDYKNKFYTLNFTYKKTDETRAFYTEKNKIDFKLGTGSRYNNQKYKQFFSELTLSHSLKLNKKNEIFIKSINYHLASATYLINELYRFGGIESIRGFRENSLQANTLTSILTEYRYHFNEDIYLHSIIDYGYLEDKTNTSKNNLKSFGIGAFISNKNSVMNFIFANGSITNQRIELKNSIFQFLIKTKF